MHLFTQTVITKLYTLALTSIFTIPHHTNDGYGNIKKLIQKILDKLLIRFIRGVALIVKILTRK